MSEVTPANVNRPLTGLVKRLSTRRAATVVALVLAWCALWGEITIANLLAGLFVSCAVMASGVGTANGGSFRLVPLIRLAGIIAVDLVVSTIGVAQEIIIPADQTNEAIIAVTVGREARKHFLLLVVAITVTPGTAVVDADPDTGTLYLHLLHAERRDAVADHVRQLDDCISAAYQGK